MHCLFDHLVFAAERLADGVDWFAARTSITLPPGGSHPLMATHNHLLALSRHSFLEVIAVDHDAPPPTRIRWFALDDTDCRERLAVSPRLHTWVVGVSDLDAALARLAEAGVDAGRAVDLTRGQLHWRIGVRDDGALLDGGTFPVLIEWPAGPHPAGAMHDAGVRLERLVLTHPEPGALLERLALIGADRLCAVRAGAPGEAPLLEAAFAIGERRVLLD